MSLYDEMNLDELRNEAERLVIEELERQLAKTRDACRSPECVLDMAAYALNLVRPMYRATLLGRLYARTTAPEDEQKIAQAVTRAIRKVTENPPN